MQPLESLVFRSEKLSAICRHARQNSSILLLLLLLSLLLLLLLSLLLLLLNHACAISSNAAHQSTRIKRVLTISNSAFIVSDKIRV